MFSCVKPWTACSTQMVTNRNTVTGQKHCSYVPDISQKHLTVCIM